jgi:hypothetical protein
MIYKVECIKFFIKILSLCEIQNIVLKLGAVRKIAVLNRNIWFCNRRDAQNMDTKVIDRDYLDGFLAYSIISGET